MLPFGHAAAGYLASVGILSATGATLNVQEAQAMLLLGGALGALPDVDMFAAFIKTRSLVIENDKQSHRAFITHTPLFWIGAGMFAYIFLNNLAVAGIIALAPLSHLFLDSLEDDVRLLWPWSNKGICILKRKKCLYIPAQDFLPYWKKFLRWYWSERRLTAMLELSLLALCLLSIGITY